MALGAPAGRGMGAGGRDYVICACAKSWPIPTTGWTRSSRLATMYQGLRTYVRTILHELIDRWLWFITEMQLNSTSLSATTKKVNVTISCYGVSNIGYNWWRITKGCRSGCTFILMYYTHQHTSSELKYTTPWPTIVSLASYCTHMPPWIS